MVSSSSSLSLVEDQVAIDGRYVATSQAYCYAVFFVPSLDPMAVGVEVML